MELYFIVALFSNVSTRLVQTGKPPLFLTIGNGTIKPKIVTRINEFFKELSVG